MRFIMYVLRITLVMTVAYLLGTIVGMGVGFFA
jgi:hypothetical protein